MLSVPLNNGRYNPQLNSTNIPMINVSVQAKSVNGAYDNPELEGNQLLVGRYVIYD